ncbi:class I SAM-dependent methyltransferase [Microlunatus elymi]|uniref:Class I SAM-dependent methyltransferase n=1 Tax=Microlunatus elymi TaxID=2596828 RepID=A0A516PVI0_9ACTN|nr:class I SAM-dependent methyltransferase [Microlunatus elymi]QDP95194.1 class I SAM-dependent methyltransferase [Microlunatus elymi]
MTDDPFGDPRLAALYDADNPAGEDHDYFRRTAGRAGVRRIVDLGCGTGLLTVTLAGPDRTVLGIDPSRTMLDLAKARPGHDQVIWQYGDASVLDALLHPGSVDLVIMSGNTAQHIVGADWHRTLRSVARVLRPGGVLTFETRNPTARAWESWSAENTMATRDTDHGPLTEWLEITAVTGFDDGNGGQLTFAAHNVFEATGEHVVFTTVLAFRTRTELTADLADAGLRIESIAGGWRNEPLTDTSRLLVVTATRSG